MDKINIDIKEEPEKRIGPIPKSMTVLSVAVVLLILFLTLVSLIIIRSPEGNEDTFLTFLLRNMNLKP